MIAERIPEIQSLTIQEKRLLMNELWEEINESGLDRPDPAIVKLLEARLEQFHSNPNSAMTLEEFRKRLGRS